MREGKADPSAGIGHSVSSLGGILGMNFAGILVCVVVVVVGVGRKYPW